MEGINVKNSVVLIRAKRRMERSTSVISLVIRYTTVENIAVSCPVILDLAFLASKSFPLPSLVLVERKSSILPSFVELQRPFVRDLVVFPVREVISTAVIHVTSVPALPVYISPNACVRGDMELFEEFLAGVRRSSAIRFVKNLFHVDILVHENVMKDLV